MFKIPFLLLKKVLFSPCDNCKDYVCLIGDLLLASSNLRKQHLLIINYVTLQNCWNYFRSYLVNLCAPKDTLASISSRSLPQLKDHFFFLLGCGPDRDGCSAHSAHCHEAVMKEHCPATCGQCKRGKTCYTIGYIRPL